MVRQLYSMLAENPKQLKIAVLSDLDIVTTERTKVLASRPAFMEGGREAAKLLLSLIRGEHPQKRIVMPPALPSYLEF